MKFYHATDYNNLSKIVHKGLIPGVDGIIYLTDSFENALKFVMFRGYERILVCEIDLDEDQVEETFDHNYAFFQCKSYGYSEVISFNDIEEMYEYKGKEDVINE